MALGAGVAYVHSFASELAVMNATVSRMESDIEEIDSTHTKSNDLKNEKLEALRREVAVIDRRVTVLCTKLIGADCMK